MARAPPHGAPGSHCFPFGVRSFRQLGEMFGKLSASSITPTYHVAVAFTDAVGNAVSAAIASNIAA